MVVGFLGVRSFSDLKEQVHLQFNAATNQFQKELTQMVQMATNSMGLHIHERLSSEELRKIIAEQTKPIAISNFVRFTAEAATNSFSGLLSAKRLETISGKDTNRVAIITFTNGASQVFIKLSAVPILSSMSVFTQLEPFSPDQLKDNSFASSANVFWTFFHPGGDASTLTFTFRYNTDPAFTNLFKTIGVENGRPLLDGKLVDFTQNRDPRSE